MVLMLLVECVVHYVYELKQIGTIDGG